MTILVHCALLFTTVIVAIDASEEHRSAVAVLVDRGDVGIQNILGTVVFSETEDGVQLTGSISGLPAGKYGFHVHERGNISTCGGAGAHFNPDETNHGGRDHTVRHVGDLGNVEFVGTTDAVATIDFVDRVLSLRGRNNVVGRTLVLHEQADDLGLTDHEDSLTTGNAGRRVACGVIGILSPVTPWNAGVMTSPSLLVFVAAIIATYLRL